MRLAWTAVAGETIEGQINLINTSSSQAQVRVTFIDLGQNAQGQWQPVNDSTVVSNPTLQYPRASCRSWIELIDPLISIMIVPPTQDPHKIPSSKTLKFCVDVPTTCSGSFLAALKIRFQTTGPKRSATMHLDYIAPVIVDVVPATLDGPAQGLNDLVTDVTLIPSYIQDHVRPGQKLSLSFQLHNQHPTEAHTAQITGRSHINHDTNQTTLSWVRDVSMSPVTIGPNDVNSLTLELEIPPQAQGRYDTSITVSLCPQGPPDLGPILHCEIPIHLEVKSDESRETPIVSPALRIINPRPFEIQRDASSHPMQGTLAIYSSTPVELQGSHPDSPWHLTALPSLIQSYPLAGFHGKGPTLDPNSSQDSLPAILTLCPSLP